MIHIRKDLQVHETKKYTERSIDQIKQIVVHHFAANASIERVAKWHVKDNDWPGIGYHVVVDVFGGVNAVNSLRTISYHCGGQNTKSIGIALAGDWSLELPYDCQIDGLISTIETIRWAVGSDIPVYPHSAFRPTECPGGPMREWLERHYPAPLPLVSYSYNPPEHPDYFENDDDKY